jgi:pilus assembly protein CpaF
MAVTVSIERADGSVENLAVDLSSPVVIGREPTCGLVLASDEVSRQHATIARHPDAGYEVTDTSANGTVVSGQRLRRESLVIAIGEPIRIGRFTLRVLADDGEPRKPREPEPVAAGPTLPPEPEEIGADVRRELLAELAVALDLESDSAPAARIKSELARIVSARSDVPLSQRDALVSELAREAIGLGPLEELLADASLDRIWVFGFDAISVERRGDVESVPIAFSDGASLRRVAHRMRSTIGADRDARVVRGQVASGWRGKIVFPPVSRAPYLALERVRPLGSFAELVASGVFSAGLARRIEELVAERSGILVCSPDRHARESVLAAIVELVPPLERVALLEGGEPIELSRRTLYRIAPGPDRVHALAALEPDRVVVADLEGADLRAVLEVVVERDAAPIATCAGSTGAALRALERGIFASGPTIPVTTVRELIAEAFVAIVAPRRGSRETRVVALSIADEGDRFVLVDEHTPSSAGRERAPR